MDGRRLKFLNIVDEFSRTCLAIRVGRRCKAMDVIDTIEELLKQYPAPTHLRMDNGPEFIAHALQEWCTGSGSGAEYIPPGSPWQNPFVESFNSRLRDKFSISRFSHRCWKQWYWQSNIGWSTIATDRTRLPRGVRLWKSSSNGRRLDHPTSSHRNWTTDRGHVIRDIPPLPRPQGPRQPDHRRNSRPGSQATEYS